MPIYLKRNLRKPEEIGIETMIEYAVSSLVNDIRIYEKLSKVYKQESAAIPQINRHLSELSDRLAKADLPKEQLEKYQTAYENIKTSLKEVGFYDN